MQKQQIGRIAGVVLALLLAPVAAVVSGWAQAGDTPIVILDGSLTMDSAVPWNQFKGSGDERTHPHGNKTVTSVTVSVAGVDKALTFNNEQVSVDITYANSHITVATGGNGKGLRVKPFGAFQNGDRANLLVHKTGNSHISHITVMKNGVAVFDSDTPFDPTRGHTKITISYR